MKKRIIITEEMAKGYTRREFLKLLELAGIGVAIGGTGFMAGCRETGSWDAKGPARGSSIST